MNGENSQEISSAGNRARQCAMIRTAFDVILVPVVIVVAIVGYLRWDEGYVAAALGLSALLVNGAFKVHPSKRFTCWEEDDPFKGCPFSMAVVLAASLSLASLAFLVVFPMQPDFRRVLHLIMGTVGTGVMTVVIFLVMAYTPPMLVGLFRMNLALCDNGTKEATAKPEADHVAHT